MGRFYLDKRYFQGKAAKWVSFESTPTLESTKKDIYDKCVPCITNLYEQLREGKREIRIGQAKRCWKVVAVLDSEQQCVELLEEFERRYLGNRRLKGRFGSGDADKQTRVIVFNPEDEEEKEALLRQVKICAGKVKADAPVFAHRGCAELYHDLLGDWREWNEVETIKRPELIDGLMEKIRKMLYWEGEGGKGGR